MNTNEYPNRDALRKANDIYLSVMRSFIRHQLQQVRGRSVEDLIEEALENHDNQVDTFLQMLGEHNDVEAAIDFNFIPHIIKKHWYNSFAQKFGQDLVAQNLIWMISKGRNSCEHIGTEDLDYEMTRAHLFIIVELLGIINRSDKQDEVETIRDQLMSANVAKQISEISGQLEVVEAEKTKYKKDLAKTKNYVEELEGKQSQYKKELERLSGIENEKKKSEEQVLKLTRDAKDYEDMWNLSEESLKAAQKNLKVVEKEKNNFEKRVTNLELQCEEVNSQKIEYEKRIKALGKELDIIKSEKATAEEQIAVLGNLLSTISIDNLKVGMVYPPINADSKFHIIDRRNTDKKNYLLQLLELKKPTLIYVQDDEMINNFMKIVGSEKWDVIGRHYKYTSLAEEKELLEKLEKGELIAIVSNDAFSALTTAHCVDHFVFCHLSDSLETIVERCKPAFTSSQNAFLHLIYNYGDREKNNNWLTQEYPTHKYPIKAELKSLYSDLRDRIGINNKYITPKDVYEEIIMDELKIQTSFAIFEELGLLTQNAVGIQLLEAKGKKLEESKIFCEGENLRLQKKEMLEFYDNQLDQTVAEFWEVIEENMPSVTVKNNTLEITKSEIADKLAQTHVNEQ